TSSDGPGRTSRPSPWAARDAHGPSINPDTRNRRRRMNTEAQPTSTGEATQEPAVRALVFTSPAHDVMGGRGTFSPTTSTLLVGRSASVLVDAQYIASDIPALA